MTILAATIERITYQSAENGYTVARAQPRDRGQPVTVVGHLPDAQVGALLELEGRWVDHPNHGRQFEVERYRTTLPATIDGIRRYLGSGLIKGIGPEMARRITETFGAETLQVLEYTPWCLNEVPGIGTRRVELIVQAWEEQRQIKQIIMFLQDIQITPALAIRIYRQYGAQALHVIRSAPYRLADDIYGIGFLTADRMAQALGIASDAPQRLASGIRYTLSQAADEGHCYVPWESLVARGARLLAAEPQQVAATLEAVVITGEVHAERIGEERRVYLTPFLRAEQGLADRVLGLAAAPSAIRPYFRSTDWPQLFERLAEQRGVQLTERQQAAVRMALEQKVSILTGGPGTGKTTTLRTVILALERRGLPYLLAAPTGRAARRLSEATGAPAMTLHRLLEFAPLGDSPFKRNADNPLHAAMIIVDEVSMLDVLLANHLFKAIPPTAHLLLVGDDDQLPSVGPGRVLRDLLESSALPSVHLDAVFRQAEGSGIIRNAHRIRIGTPPETRDLEDFFFFRCPEPQACAELTVDLVLQRIPRRFGLNPQHDIQVLSPMHRGPAGVSALNAGLQAALNPPHPARPEQRFGSSTFRQGDRVMQLRNNYDLDVFNGDIGEITGLDHEQQQLTVRYDDTRLVTYEFSQLDELMLAYASSIHKAQGSEYPCVVVPLLTEHYALLQRNLLYTAVTRARQLVVLVGDPRALAIAVANQRVERRYTGLAERCRRQAAP